MRLVQQRRLRENVTFTLFAPSRRYLYTFAHILLRYVPCLASIRITHDRSILPFLSTTLRYYSTKAAAKTPTRLYEPIHGTALCTIVTRVRIGRDVSNT